MSDNSKLDDLTAFEVMQAERACGVAFEKLGDTESETPGRTALLGALAWVHKKRSEPTLTFDAYMKSVKFDEPADYLFPPEEDGEGAGFPVAVGPDGGADGAGVEPGDGEGPVLSGDRGAAE